MANYVYISGTGDAARNLAADGWLLDNVRRGDRILYFYVNTRAVIIGRHQNAWKECCLSAMARDGVQLVRRHTGGGAVYHDAGNLNFSFIMNERDYDLGRQMRVITNAVSALGLEPELSGRNDVLIDGKKFSGNAYGLAKGNRSHHGTLLVNADLSVFGNLNVSAAKMRAKGVESVRSRVCNLADCCEGVSVDGLRQLVIRAFAEEYGEPEELVFDEAALREIDARTDLMRSWDWVFGRTPEFDYTVDERFSFGETQLHFKLKEGVIRSCRVYSDSLNVALVPELERVLPGRRFVSEDIIDAIRGADEAAIGAAEKEELAAWFTANGPEQNGE